MRRVYNLAKRDVAGYEMHAARIAKLLKDEPVFLSSVLACLFHIAAADGILHPAEDRFLENVATIFRLDRGEYLSIRATYVNDPRSPYAILGLAPERLRRGDQGSLPRARAHASSRSGLCERRAARVLRRRQPQACRHQRRLRCHREGARGSRRSEPEKTS